MRYWWPTSNFSNYMPNLRAKWNPMEYVYRSAGMVKGNHSYSIIIDDLKKDANQHLYQWTAMSAKGVWKAEYPNLPTGALVLAHDDKLEKDWAKGTEVAPLNPKKGDPMVLLYSIAESGEGNNLKIEVAKEGKNLNGAQFTNFESAIPSYNRIVLDRNATQANFKILMIPFTYGEELPTISANANKATIFWKDGQKDVLEFKVANNRTSVAVIRGGKVIVASK